MTVEVRLLGGAALGRGDDQVPVTGARPAAVLAFLAASAGRSISTDELVDAVWGDEPPRTVRAALQVHVATLRKALAALDADLLRTVAGGYVLDVDPEQVDVRRLARLRREAEASAARGDWPAVADAAADARALWRGRPLQGAAGTIAVDRFIQEATADHDRCVRLGLRAAVETGRAAAVLPAVETLAAADPHDEATHELLVRALYLDGRQDRALAVARELRRRLADDLGVDPTPSFVAVEQAVLDHDPALGPASPTVGTDTPEGATPRASAPPAAAGPAPEAATEPARPAPDLPAADTPLIGRRDELASLAATLTDPGTRLVTLTGPGGVGKTRLSLAIARQVAPSFVDGVHVVDVSGVRDPSLVLPTIATPLAGAAATAGPVLEQLAAALAGRRLLVLDNLEQVVAAAADVAELLRAAPGLTILATSRVPLRIRAERRHPVAPLGLPGAGDDPLGSDAVVLLVDRIRAVDPSFDPVGRHDALARICRRLDGIPLALELAAARVDVLGLDGLARALDSALDVLVDGPVDLPERHQTLRRAIAWSVDLLPLAARDALVAMGTFRGDVTPEALVAVAGSDDATTHLATLAQHALVQRRDGTSRWWMYEVVREHALDLQDEPVATRGRLLAHHRQLARAGRAAMERGEAIEWIDRIGAVHADVVSSFEHALATGDTAAAAALLGDHTLYWFTAGRHRELAALLGRLEGTGDVDRLAPGILADLENIRGRLVFETDGDGSAAAQAMRRSLAHARAAADDDRTGRALSNLGAMLLDSRQLEEARPILQETVERERAGDNLWNLAVALHNLSSLHEALGEFRESLAVSRKVTDILVELGDHDREAASRISTAEVLVHVGDVDEAVREVSRALGLAQEHDLRAGVTRSDAVLTTALVVAAAGRPVRAAGLLGRLDALMSEEELGLNDRRFEPVLAALAAADERAVADARAAGRAAGVDGIFRACLDELDAVAGPGDQATASG